jgi:hypothetical protein
MSALQASQTVAGNVEQTVTAVGRSSAGSARTAHITAKQDSAQVSSKVSNSVQSAQDASLIPQDSAAVRAVAGIVSNPNAASQQSSSSTPTVHDTFAALDSGNGTDKTTWVHTGSQQAEAGYHDPELGWISVRADSASGAVHASVVPSSESAGQTLNSHMAGLNDYLTERHSSVASVTVASPENRAMTAAGDQGSGQNSGQSMNPGAGNGGGQNSSENAGQSATATPVASPLYGTRDPSATTGVAEAAVAASVSSGGHISVMA